MKVGKEPFEIQTPVLVGTRGVRNGRVVVRVVRNGRVGARVVRNGRVGARVVRNGRVGARLGAETDLRCFHKLGRSGGGGGFQKLRLGGGGGGGFYVFHSVRKLRELRPI